MVLAVGKDDERNVFRSSFPDGPLFNGRLMLLTDGLSASASEVMGSIAIVLIHECTISSTNFLW